MHARTNPGIFRMAIYNFSENWIPIFVKNSFYAVNIFSMQSQRTVWIFAAVCVRLVGLLLYE